MASPCFWKPLMRTRMMGSLKLAAPSWLPLEGLWTTRCVACDQSITGNSKGRMAEFARKEQKNADR